MKTRASRKPFIDPFDKLSDAAFEREVLEALERGTTKISLRVPNELLVRTRDAAGRRGVPYQSLIKVLIDQATDRDIVSSDQGVRRLERAPVSPDRHRQRSSVRRARART